MPANYVLLGEVTLAETATSVTLANIPQSGYTDLKLVMSVRDARTGIAVSDIRFNFNGTGVGTNISGRYLYGTGSSAASSTITTGELAFGDAGGATANTFGNAEVYIPNYLSTTTYKSISSDSVAETNATGGYTLLLAGLWSSNSAINSISMTPFTSPFAAGSTFYLYGIAAVGTTPVIAPFASGGDIITNDGTYWIHTFLSSGTFTPRKSLTCGYLVVAGGGGGGGTPSGLQEGGGGGGSGGLRSAVTATGGGGSLESALSLTSQGYTVTIGAGGAASTSGNDSIFSTITSAGGGKGAQGNGGIGFNGGSGGGAANYSTGGLGTANQGYAGGAGASQRGSGGGGAGAVGATGTVSGAGGAGVATSITGSSVTYAGGGGGGGSYTGGALPTGGAGGSGGGGAGGNGNSGTGTAGTANLGAGGGGGAGSGTSTGGAGGSGIVIIRYPIA